jgi:tetratricopeptide (TPR) repeat protein
LWPAILAVADMATIVETLATGLQHHQAGRLQAAEQIYRQVLTAEPNQADALHLLGMIAHQAGQYAVAVEYIERAIALRGSAAGYHNNLGTVYRAMRRLPEAVACYRRALELAPGLAEAHSNLGNALRDLGKLDEAVASCHRALQLKPDFAEAHNNLGNALNDQGKSGESLVCYRRALELKPDFAEAHNNLGNVFRDQRKHADAMICYRQALKLRPDSAEAHNSVGIALEETGDLQAAEACFRAALLNNPSSAMAHYKLAELLRGKLPQEDVAAQHRLLEAKDTTDAQRLFLHFGLALVLDARGKYAEAAQHLEWGNALQLSEWRKRGQQYDPIEHRSFISQMIRVCTTQFFDRVRDCGSESELPVFVFGLPRSGTTLIEQILAGHSHVYGVGELPLGRQTFDALPGVLGRSEPPIDCLPNLGASELQRLAADHEARLRAFGGGRAERAVDKLPDNYVYLGLLAALFPKAVFIHCRRDLRDVAVSCWMTHFQKVPWASDQEHLLWRFHDYRRLMDHWRKVLPARFLEVDYEETVGDLEAVARRLVASCGLKWEPACLDFHLAKRPVRTASVVQVRQPVFKTSVGRWKHYTDALDPLFARLESAESGVETSRDLGTELCEVEKCLREKVTRY